MRVPMVATFKESHAPDVRETSVRVFHPETAEKQKRDYLRYLVLAIAFVAVVLLIAIALYYTQGDSIHIQHTSAVFLEPGLRV
jgi:formate hydrogenlyase subunit 3/multisubunit Na+/H+ antiporter MnhD subunit